MKIKFVIIGFEKFSSSNVNEGCSKKKGSKNNFPFSFIVSIKYMLLTMLEKVQGYTSIVTRINTKIYK